jgi:hypothetical protein
MSVGYLSASAQEAEMFDGLRNRIDDILRAVDGDEDAFNRVAKAERLDVYLRHGRLYPSAIGQTHTSRLAAGLLSAGMSMPSAIGRN